MYRYIGSQEDRNFLKDNISAYADTQEVTEICAESFSVRKENVVAQTILQLIGGDSSYDVKNEWGRKKTYIKYLEEKNIEQKEILYKKYQNLRKEREAEQLKDCPFAH